ncbi:MAG: GspE/PulE family protein [Planctomycetota bacterium]
MTSSLVLTVVSGNHRRSRCPSRGAPGGRARAADVHFEPVEGGIEVRLRLDGVLQPAATIPSELAAPVVARLKVLAGLATYRTDVPQDGRISIDGLGQETGGADLRLSTYPTVRGEKAVVRLFAARAEEFRLRGLGFGDGVVGVLEQALASREGLVVLTGPAGSGKTTTIYASVQHVRDSSRSGRAGSGGGSGRHIVTIEDPVECLLPGVTQTQTNPPAGLTFANCLGSILRQDPEVIVVGEVRDAATAELALQAALTGHLVVTTVHAGTAPGVFSRLVEMGTEPYLVTSVVRAALAQRLVRRLCPGCRTRTEGGSDGNADAGWTAPGCDECLGTGFRGRVPIAEILTLSPQLRGAVLARADLEGLERAARDAGMRTLAEAGEELARSGATSREELARVLAGLRPPSAKATGGPRSCGEGGRRARPDGEG